MSLTREQIMQALARQGYELAETPQADNTATMQPAEATAPPLSVVKRVYSGADTTSFMPTSAINPILLNTPLSPDPQAVSTNIDEGLGSLETAPPADPVGLIVKVRKVGSSDSDAALPQSPKAVVLTESGKVIGYQG